VQQLAKGLGVSVLEFLNGEEEAQGENPERPRKSTPKKLRKEK
jgi:hypothetical protein